MTFNLDDFAISTFLPGVSDQQTVGFVCSVAGCNLSGTIIAHF